MKTVEMEHVLPKKNVAIWGVVPKVHVQMVMEYVVLVSINISFLGKVYHLNTM